MRRKFLEKVTKSLVLCLLTIGLADIAGADPLLIGRFTRVISRTELLRDYEARFLQNLLRVDEFNYAQTWLCPKDPSAPELHVCNSSAVGNGKSANDQVNTEPSPFHVTIGDDSRVICLDCLRLLR